MSQLICRSAICGHVHCNTIKKLQAAGVFFREFVQAPSSVGSICPSSKSLGASLIDAVPLEGDGLIIDLGAGSGIVSEGLVRAGVSPERILAVELSEGFSRLFNKRCPGVPLVIGDARYLGSIISGHNAAAGVDAIISSLPLRVLPAALASAIMGEMRNVLNSKGGLLVQYTYAWWMRYPLRRYGLAPRSSRLVWRNIPPAKVESYAVIRNQKTRELT